ncbi:uncharacterized protein LOC113464962 [Ceratina calcarata]|uniref:Uncharacterized protein LOC113464962 n=1 Tax=Ceratina calcarata TaxID=156304 RepID=A0AAJ7WEV0_9HYME|nr:uncharacterized protein LOC113464962 [Ceratina calcarata]
MKYKEDAVNFWRSGKRKNLSVGTVKNKYKKVTSLKQLCRWKEQIDNGGSRNDKLECIAKATLTKFMEARNQKMIVHDIDLKRWALQENQKLNLERFQATTHWLWNLKTKYGIVSRKTTKFVTRNYNENVDIINKSAENFILDVRQYFQNHEEACIYNTDQSGFQLEMHSGRTLSWRGEKATKTLIQSSSAVTHSYTIQPTISADGKLLSPLFLVLKESGGQLGPRVQDHLFKPSNIIIGASSSGKLNKELLKTWLTEAFLPNMPERAVLLFDSWNGYDEAMIHDEIPEGKKLEILKIPKNTTGLVQPLDVYGFRIWKNFARKLSDLAINLSIDINLFSRNNIIMLQSLIHNQLSSPRYRNLFKYAWYRCGYTNIRPTEFENPVQFCFTNIDVIKCSLCNDVVALRCSWCRNHLCFKHYFQEYHFCEKYIE